MISERSTRFLEYFATRPDQADGDLGSIWLILRKALREEDVAFVALRGGRKEAARFRRIRFMVYVRALLAAHRETRQRMKDAIAARAAARTGWNFPDLLCQEACFHRAFLQLWWAGGLFLMRSERAAEQFDRARARLVEAYVL